MDDILCSALLRLVAKLRIGQLGSSHDNQIGLIRLQNFFGLLRRIDPAYGNGHHLRFSSDSRGILYIEAPRNINGRNLIYRTGCDDISPGHVQNVHSIFSCNTAEFDNFLDGQAAGKIIIVSVDAHEQRHIPGDGAADRPDALQRKSRPVLKASSILVRPVIKASA